MVLIFESWDCGYYSGMLIQLTLINYSLQFSTFIDVVMIANRFQLAGYNLVNALLRNTYIM